VSKYEREEVARILNAFQGFSTTRNVAQRLHVACTQHHQSFEGLGLI